MEHLMESRSGEHTARDMSPQAEQEPRCNMYHNTKMVLKHYRDIVRALECFPQKIAEDLDRPCAIWICCPNRRMSGLITKLAEIF